MNTSTTKTTPTPRHFWHTLTTTAHTHDIWKIWTDVSRWHHWDKGLQSSSLHGLFQKGTKGSLISLNGTVSQFMITEYQEGISYTFATKLPLAQLHVKRTVFEQNNTVTFTHEVWFDGLLGWFFALLLGKNFMKMLPSVMEEVREIAETSPSFHET